MAGSHAQAYMKAYKAAQRADDAFQKELVKQHKSRAGDMRYRPQTTAKLEKLKKKKIAADAKMHQKLQAMRAAGESVNPRRAVLPRGKWIRGAVKVSRSGKIQFKRGR